jgi:hypothetical protein
LRSAADGANCFSRSVDLAGGVRRTVVKTAAFAGDDKNTERPKGDIAKPKKAKKPTGKTKTGVDTV